MEAITTALTTWGTTFASDAQTMITTMLPNKGISNPIASIVIL